MARTLNGGIIGCGFFATHHIEAWRRIPDVAIIAAADPELDRARALAPRAYRLADEMLAREQLDFVDIVARADQHHSLVRLAVDRKIPIICQKPFAPDWPTAVEMVNYAEAAGVPLMIHENWRWQPWYRIAHEMIRRGDIGSPICYGFRSRASDGVGAEPYPQQPYFRQLRRFLIDEALVHHIDVASFLFGDIKTIYAQAGRRNRTMTGEDWAILTLTHKDSVHGWIDGHRFLDPQPDGPVAGDAFFEGETGTISIAPTGDVYRNHSLVWKNDVTVGYRGDSVAATQAHFIDCLKSQTPSETEGRRYLHTFAAVQAAYQSVAELRSIPVSLISSTSPDKSDPEEKSRAEDITA
jgi:predicted dehydrogenase